MKPPLNIEKIIINIRITNIRGVNSLKALSTPLRKPSETMASAVPRKIVCQLINETGLFRCSLKISCTRSGTAAVEFASCHLENICQAPAGNHAVKTHH